MNPPPPMPHEDGFTTHTASEVAIAASTAEPPSRSTRNPTSTASGLSAATTPSPAEAPAPPDKSKIQQKSPAAASATRTRLRLERAAIDDACFYVRGRGHATRVRRAATWRALG